MRTDVPSRILHAMRRDGSTSRKPQHTHKHAHSPAHTHSHTDASVFAQTVVLLFLFVPFAVGTPPPSRPAAKAAADAAGAGEEGKTVRAKVAYLENL